MAQRRRGGVVDRAGFVFGYALTMRSVLRSGLSIGAAFKVALAADTMSIAVIELVDNAVVVAVPGAMAARLTSSLFWLSLAASVMMVVHDGMALATADEPPVDRRGHGKGNRQRCPRR